MHTPDNQPEPSVIFPEQPARGWRGYCWSIRISTATALALAVLVVVLVNILAHRIPWRNDFSQTGKYRLTENTRLLIEGLRHEVRITSMVRPDHELANQIGDLLREYDYASPLIQIAQIDPYRDLLHVQKLAEQHGLRESNLVLFESGARQRIVNIEEIAEFDYLPVLYGEPRRLKSFKGEAAFSSAIHGVTDQKSPIVYAVRGHRERDLNDPHPVSGYSALASLIRNEQMTLRDLRIAEAGGIPSDTDLLLIAGPRSRMTDAELEIVANYLDNNGRLLLLLDRVDSSLESILERWGVTVGRGTVTGLTLSGSELFVGEYGDHPITGNLRGMSTVFYRPRPLYPNEHAIAASDQQADRLRVNILAAGRDVIQAADRPTPEQAVTGAHPPIALAVEKGSVLGGDTRLRQTRLVIFGDADFLSNHGMVAANGTLLVNALNWLVERDHRLDIPPSQPHGDVLLMHRKSLSHLFQIGVVVIPAFLLALAIAMRFAYGNTE